MEFEFLNLETCHTASDVAVVIDVLRAFSTAAYAFDAGATQILPVATIEEGFLLRSRIPGSLLMGEVNTLRVPGFDMGNSPTLDGKDVRGRTLIHRTSAGTQGIVRTTRARVVIASSFVVASATAKMVRELNPDRVSFVITGILDKNDGEEDRACGELIRDILLGREPAVEQYIESVHQSTAGQRFLNPDLPDYPLEDLKFCLDIDRFDFAMQVSRESGGLILRPA